MPPRPRLRSNLPLNVIDTTKVLNTKGRQVIGVKRRGNIKCPDSNAIEKHRTDALSAQHETDITRYSQIAFKVGGQPIETCDHGRIVVSYCNTRSEIRCAPDMASELLQFGFKFVMFAASIGVNAVTDLHSSTSPFQCLQEW